MQSGQEFGQQLDIANLIGQGFTETTTSRLNQRTGEQQRAPDALQVGEQFFLPPIPQVGTKKLSEDRYETVVTNAIGTGELKGQKVNIIRDKHTNKEFERAIFTADKDSKDPQPEKWKNFGVSISEFKTLDKNDGDYENKRTAARQSAYATMLPNAWGFYKKYFIDEGSEKVSNKHFLSRVRWGVQKDLISDEEAQDLIDFSSYRSDLFKINK